MVKTTHLISKLLLYNIFKNAISIANCELTEGIVMYGDAAAVPRVVSSHKLKVPWRMHRIGQTSSCWNH